jgi:hypothetical protein
MLLNDESEKIRKEVIVAYFKVLSQHFSGWREADHSPTSSAEVKE